MVRARARVRVWVRAPQLLVNGTFSGFPNSPTGGILFVKYVWPVLSQYGRLDLALTLLQQTTVPSFGFWIEGGPPGDGATTLWCAGPACCGRGCGRS
jgi:hypothetical protein